MGLARDGRRGMVGRIWSRPRQCVLADRSARATHAVPRRRSGPGQLAPRRQVPRRSQGPHVRRPLTDAGSSISTPAGLTLSDQQLEAWRTVLEDRTRRLADRGCGYLMLVVPDAHSVYPEDLPRKLRLVDERPVHRLLAHLSQSGSPARVGELYPLDELLERKREQEIFPRTDEHWNEAAAFAAYETVAAMLSEETPMRVLPGGRGGDLEADGVRKPRLQATMAAPVAACPRLRAALGCSAGHGQRDRGERGARS